MHVASSCVVVRTAAIFLMAGAILAIAFMLHHPSTVAEDFSSALMEIRSESAIAGWVHGLLMLVLAAIWFGGYGLTLQYGFSRSLPVLALMCFTVGTLAYFLAASVSGFIVPGIAASLDDSIPGALEQGRALLTVAGQTNQVFAQGGVIGTALGIFFWSMAQVMSSGRLRLIGIFGLVVSILPVFTLFSGHLHLHVTGMTSVVVAHGAWYFLSGWHLLKARVD